MFPQSWNRIRFFFSLSLIHGRLLAGVLDKRPALSHTFFFFFFSVFQVDGREAEMKWYTLNRAGRKGERLRSTTAGLLFPELLPTWIFVRRFSQHEWERSLWRITFRWIFSCCQRIQQSCPRRKTRPRTKTMTAQFCFVTFSFFYFCLERVVLKRLT